MIGALAKEQGSVTRCARLGRGSQFNRVVRVGLSEMLKQETPEGGEGISPGDS